VVDALRDVRADVLGVALGNPKQERWIARWSRQVGAPVCIGIGGTLDFLTGTTTRAPDWMQRAGLEWIHRASSEPRRLVGRYAHDLVVFGPALIRQMWTGRRRRHRGALVVADAAVVGEPATIELAGLRRLDNAAVAELVAVERAIHLDGRRSVIAGPSPQVLADAGRLGVTELVAPTETRTPF
jgi:ABC-type transporter Mla MlaB component